MLRQIGGADLVQRRQCMCRQRQVQRREGRCQVRHGPDPQQGKSDPGTPDHPGQRNLTAATGLTPPSIYAAFGDKKGPFRAAVQRCCAGPVTSAAIIASAPTARDAARNLMQAAAIGDTGEDMPPGCLLATGARRCLDAAADLHSELAAIRHQIDSSLCARIKTEQLPEAPVLAAHVMAVIHRLSTLARDGAPRGAAAVGGRHGDARLALKG